MAMRNADVLRRQFEMLGRGGLEAAAEFWDPHIEWRAVEGAADDVGVIEGHAALRRYYQDWIDTFTDLRAQVIEVIFEGDELVVAAIRNSGRARESEARIEGSYYVLCTIREELIVSGREYDSRQAAIAALAQFGQSLGES
jgi:ketosteroid isomerase-like protein